MPNTPNLIVFAQHGMTDTNQTMTWLANHLAPEQALVIAPDLGYLRTLWHIEPLIEMVDQVASTALTQYPHLPVRIIATSLGGVIWLEVLDRHPDWWVRIQSLILLGSPIGGSDLARIVDPLGWGIGIAKGLGVNRRSLAEKIAAVIPTLIIAGETNGGSDGTVALESTKFKYAHFVCLSGVNHPALRHHPTVAAAIREFWAASRQPLPAASVSLSQRLIQHLYAVEGMTDTHRRDFARAKTWLLFKDGTQIRLWKHPLGVIYVFVGDAQKNCAYSGRVGWLHRQELEQALALIKQEFSSQIMKAFG